MKRKSALQKSKEQIAIEYQLAMTEVAKARGMSPEEAQAFAQRTTREQRDTATQADIEKRRKNKEWRMNGRR